MLTRVTSGDPSDLRVDVATNFDHCLNLGISYRPNDTEDPLALTLGKGSSSDRMISVEFKPQFRFDYFPEISLRYKVSFNDLTVKKTVKAPDFQGMLLSEVSATSSLPVIRDADCKIHWGLKLHVEFWTGPKTPNQKVETPWWWFSPGRFPVVMKKISMELRRPAPNAAITTDCEVVRRPLTITDYEDLSVQDVTTHQDEMPRVTQEKQGSAGFLNRFLHIE
ncbi:hypothetical protein J5N97_000739 [Dioscorea zingiberensis]|uniref:Uncharacterized protein n=1 Tax=Dioscorea zingiberensis TaxID=325984 RepID=A0A9D5BV74_9LILI|nr:hypothetical protein J5N97_000739 [Dioscorea zingiberensis]